MKKNEQSDVRKSKNEQSDVRKSKNEQSDVRKDIENQIDFIIDLLKICKEYPLINILINIEGKMNKLSFVLNTIFDNLKNKDFNFQDFSIKPIINPKIDFKNSLWRKYEFKEKNKNYITDLKKLVDDTINEIEKAETDKENNNILFKFFEKIQNIIINME